MWFSLDTSLLGVCREEGCKEKITVKLPGYFISAINKVSLRDVKCCVFFHLLNSLYLNQEREDSGIVRM